MLYDSSTTTGEPRLHITVTPEKNHLIGLNLTLRMLVLDFFTKLLLSIVQHLPTAKVSGC
jgi:hypothetical protein